MYALGAFFLFPFSFVAGFPVILLSTPVFVCLPFVATALPFGDFPFAAAITRTTRHKRLDESDISKLDCQQRRRGEGMGKGGGEWRVGVGEGEEDKLYLLLRIETSQVPCLLSLPSSPASNAWQQVGRRLFERNISFNERR